MVCVLVAPNKWHTDWKTALSMVAPWLLCIGRGISCWHTQRLIKTCAAVSASWFNFYCFCKCGNALVLLVGGVRSSQGPPFRPAHPLASIVILVLQFCYNYCNRCYGVGFGLFRASQIWHVHLLDQFLPLIAILNNVNYCHFPDMSQLFVYVYNNSLGY